MARYMIAYVCPGADQREKSWVLGALANDDSGFAIAANPKLDVDAAAAGTKLSSQSLRNWERALRALLDQAPPQVYDPTLKQRVPVAPNAPYFLNLLAAESLGEWNYYFSPIEEMPGDAAEVARSKAADN